MCKPLQLLCRADFHCAVVIAVNRLFLISAGTGADTAEIMSMFDHAYRLRDFIRIHINKRAVGSLQSVAVQQIPDRFAV